jgi:hypothetical protein
MIRLIVSEIVCNIGITNVFSMISITCGIL